MRGNESMYLWAQRVSSHHLYFMHLMEDSSQDDQKSSSFTKSLAISPFWILSQLLPSMQGCGLPVRAVWGKKCGYSQHDKRVKRMKLWRCGRVLSLTECISRLHDYLFAGFKKHYRIILVYLSIILHPLFSQRHPYNPSLPFLHYRPHYSSAKHIPNHFYSIVRNNYHYTRKWCWRHMGAVEIRTYTLTRLRITARELS